MKSIHFFAMVMLGISFLLQSIIIFPNQKALLEKNTLRKVSIILQHLAFTMLLVTGAILLFEKHFQVATWFYLKMVLVIALFSASLKAMKNTDILPIQRQAGLVIAWLGFIGILLLIYLKPVLFFM